MQSRNFFVIFWVGLTLAVSGMMLVSVSVSAESEARQAARDTVTAMSQPPVASIGGQEAPPASALSRPVQDNLASNSPAPTIPPVYNRNFDLGVHVRGIQPNVAPEVMRGYLDAAANQLNLNWIHLHMRWDYIETEPGQYDWGNWDMVFAQASDARLRVLVSVVGSPEWARPIGANLEHAGPPLEPSTYAAFLETLVRRYPGQIHAVEIWNAMNLSREWSTPQGLNAGDYVALASLAAESVRRIDPNIILISGALVPTGGDGGLEAQDDFVYMDALIGNGLLDSVDCVGAQHSGYNIAPDVAWDSVPADNTAQFRGPFDNPHHSWSFYSTLTTYANKIAAAGYETPLCITEFGWASAQDLNGYAPEAAFAVDNTLDEQGAWTVKAVELVQEWGFVWLAFLSNLNYGPEDAFNTQNSSVAYSLIRPDYAVSPAWLPISQMNFRGRLASASSVSR